MRKNMFDPHCICSFVEWQKYSMNYLANFPLLILDRDIAEADMMYQVFVNFFPSSNFSHKIAMINNNYNVAVSYTKIQISNNRSYLLIYQYTSLIARFT